MLAGVIFELKVLQGLHQYEESVEDERTEVVGDEMEKTMVISVHSHMIRKAVLSHHPFSIII